MWGRYCSRATTRKRGSRHSPLLPKEVTMKRFMVIVFVIGLLMSAGQASAQERGFIRGLGGVTVGTAETDAIYSGSVGVNIGPVVQIVGEVGRMQNVLSKDLQADLNDFADFISGQSGANVRIDVTVPALYATGGVRINAPSGKVRPFVEGSVGFARLTFNVKAAVAGIDISDEVKESAVGDDDNETDLLISLGGGVSIPIASATAVEIGYRYGRVLVEDSGLNTNTAYGAISFKF
jgi:opacity protein-like surface antigen